MLAALAVAAAVAGLASGCSSRGEFPAVLDNATPRNDTPLSPDQVKQATDDLISARDRLSTEAAAGPDATAPASAPSPKPKVAKANPKKVPAGHQPAAAGNAASGSTQTAGAGVQP